MVLLFGTKSVHVVRFTGTRQTCFAASDVTTVNGARNFSFKARG